MAPRSAQARSRIPRGVWVLGFVSLLMDISSEMIHSLLPLFLVGSLGVGVLAVGIIEGIAESTALVSKVFSGVLSDALGRRKGLALLGYGLGAMAKPAFALAEGAGTVVAARFVDRVGKGIRGAPRDALLADLTAPDVRGAAFGLRQSLDTVGAFVGPLLATVLMIVWAGDFRAVFWVAVVPALLSVVLLAAGIREPTRSTPTGNGHAIRRPSLARLGPRVWGVVGIGAVFTLARFSEAFLVLRAAEVGVATAWVPLVMVAMNLVYAATAYPFGRLSDTMDRRMLLAAGLVVLVLSDLVLATAGHWAALGIGVALWGVHMGLTQGLLAAMVADAAPEELRGTAFGVFNLVAGVAMLASSALAGLLWQAVGSVATFLAGAGFAALTLASVVWIAVRERATRA
jgi:MFS family permease